MTTLPRIPLLTLLGLAIALGYSNAAPVSYMNHEAWKAGKTIKSRATEKPGANAPATYPVKAIFAAAPAITSFSPLAGAVGTLVTVHGANLSAPTGFDIGGRSAIVVSNTGSILVAMVMPGAATGKVGITTAGGAASSSNSFTVTATQSPVVQVGQTLSSTGEIGASGPGYSVSLSADGNTAIAGSPNDNHSVGAAWTFTRSGSTWTQQAKFIGLGNAGPSKQGTSVTISADGNTAIVGGDADNSGVGAAWIFIRSGSTWIQQGPKLVGTGNVGASAQASSAAISADGNTAIIGANGDNSGVGAAWVFIRSGVTWTQQGPKLVGTGSVGAAGQGLAVSISADGNTAILGGDADNSGAGAAWVFTRSGGAWTQQGSKLVGTGNTGAANQGSSVSLSADGNTAMVGGLNDNAGIGAAWAYARSGGAWVQQGLKLVGTGGQGAPQQGSSVSLSADGNTAIVGAYGDHAQAGAIWVYTRSGGSWAQPGPKLISSSGARSDELGSSVSLNANGAIAIAGGVSSRLITGQVWVFTASSNASLTSIAVTPSATLTIKGTVGSTTNYTTSVSNTTASVMITPITADPTSTVTVNGTMVASGTASASIALVVGLNTINTVVTAQDGATTHTYSITITRESNDATLSVIKLTPTTTLTNTGTSGSTTTYAGSVANSTASVTVTPTTHDPNATVTVNGIAVTSGTASGSIALPGGQGAATTITIVVTASDGTTTHTYSVILTHAISTDALLGSLTLSPASTLTNNGTTGSTTTYTTSVSTTTASVTVTPTTEDPAATVTVNGIAVTSGAASGPIAIAPGTTTAINIVVTAQDGTTSHTYAIAVSTGTAILSSIALTPSSVLVNTGTSGTTTTYTALAGNATASVTVTPTTQDPTAKVTVNGTAVSSGAASGPVAIAFGQTTINILVTAQNGTTTHTYSIVVTRLSNNAALRSIGLTPASTLTNTGTTGNITTYTSSVSNATTLVSVTPITQDPNATVTVNGVAVTSATASGSIALAEGGTTAINAVVTSADGTTTMIYRIIVTRAASADASLATVLLNTGSSTIEFGGTSASVSVSNATTNVTVTPTSNDPNAKITVNGVAVTSGAASGNIALPQGSNTINVVVTSQDGSATKTYPVIVTRQSNDDLLSSIELTPAALLINTNETGGNVTYTTTVSNATSSVTITPTAEDPNATVMVNGTVVPSGTSSGSIAIPEGVTTLITINVASQDGSATIIYTVEVTRSAVSNASLSVIKLTPASVLTNTGTVGNTTTYTTSVGTATASVTVTATSQDPDATITVNGVSVGTGTASAPIPLAIGQTTISTVVTAEDGTTTRTYSIVVTRPPSTNASVSVIKLTPASALTNTGTVGSTTSYTTSVSNATTSVTVTSTAQDATATIEVNGVAVASGTASGSIALAVGDNTITIISTAQDGTTTETYTITVTRASGPLMSLRLPVSVVQPTNDLSIENDGVMVHQGVSPNGDGINDFLTIDGLAAYPDNNLMIIDRSGAIIFETAGYDNITKVFDGHSSINGRMQQPGTYFYALDYMVNGQNRHKTGFIVLKY